MANSTKDKVELNKDFTEIPLEGGEKLKKLPKRLVYFSDGVLEEYSSDEEEVYSVQDTQLLVDPQTLPWMPYLGYLTWWFGSKTLSVCDYLGEHLAYFLGITSPKFQYEIEQYQKIIEEEEALKKKIAEDNAGWITCSSEEKNNDLVQMEPVATEAFLDGACVKVVTKESNIHEPQVYSQNWNRY